MRFSKIQGAFVATFAVMMLGGCQQSSFTSKGGLRPLGLKPERTQRGDDGSGSPTDPRPGLQEGAEAAIKVVWRAPETTEHNFRPWRRGQFKFEIRRSSDSGSDGDSGGEAMEILSFDSTSSRSSLEAPVTRITEKVIRCGEKNYLELTITADGQTKTLGDWSQELISSHSRPADASDWEEFVSDMEKNKDSSRRFLTGMNQTVFIGGFDHGTPSEKCNGSNFVCDSRAWNNRDDFQGIFTMDLSKCQEGKADGTEIHFKGMQGA